MDKQNRYHARYRPLGGVLVFTSTTPLRLKPKDKDYFDYDHDGLALKVRTTGRKVWVVRYWQNGKEYRKKIGEYPLMSLLEARRTRDEMKIRVRSGEAATSVTASRSFFSNIIKPSRKGRR